MQHLARVIARDPMIEEQITLEISGVEFIAFSYAVPRNVEIGQDYRVEIGITVLDDLEVKETSEPQKGLERTGDGFQHRIRGVMLINAIDCGFVIDDDDGALWDYRYMQGSYVEVVVDRITAWFLE